MSREHFEPLVFSILLHAGFAVIFLVGIRISGEITVVASGPVVESIQARIVTAAELERAIQARDQEIARAQQAVQDQQQRERDRNAERERQRRLEARQAEDRGRQEAEALEARRDAERIAAEEQARQNALRRQSERESELRSALDAEAQREDAIQSGLLAEYVSDIQQKVIRNWSPPQNLPDGLICVVRVEQLPTGDVSSVRITSCNGNDIIVRSIEAAVWKASPLPKPSDMSVFERTIDFVFNPREN